MGLEVRYFAHPIAKLRERSNGQEMNSFQAGASRQDERQTEWRLTIWRGVSGVVT